MYIFTCMYVSTCTPLSFCPDEHSSRRHILRLATWKHKQRQTQKKTYKTPISTTFLLIVTKISTLTHVHTRTHEHAHTHTHTGKRQFQTKLFPREYSTTQLKGVTATLHTATLSKLCNTLQHTGTYCYGLQHIATHCNTSQHTATH